MIHLKNLILEYVKYKVAKAPRRLIKLSEEYGGNAFRIKLIGRDSDNPTFNDIKEVLDYDRYFGPNSRYADGEYIYVVSDDLRDSAKRSFYDIAIYELKKLPKSEDGSAPVLDIKEKFKVGKSKAVMLSDFEKLYPTSSWMSRIKDAFRSASLETTFDSSSSLPLDSSNIKNNNVSTDDKSKNSVGDDTKNPEPSSNIDIKSTNTVVLNNDETAEIDGIKISKKDLTDNISKIKTDQTYLKQFQLLMNQAITKLVTANPTIKTSKDYKNNLLPFVNAKSKYGQTFGPATQSALRSMNKAYLKFSGKTKEEIASYGDDILLEITPGLLDTMFEKGLKESTIKLSSILKEILLEQGGFDFSDNDEIEVIKTQNVKTSKNSSKSDNKTIDNKKTNNNAIDNKKSDKQDQKQKEPVKPDNDKKQEPKPSGSNKLVRMPNGYISCTNTINQLKQEAEDDTAPGLGRWFTDSGTKKLLYGKNVKVRKGIDRLPLSGMQSSIKNVWRGYEEIVDKVKWYDGGAITANPVKWYYMNVMKGTILSATIGDVKCVFAEFNAEYKSTKGMNLYTYVWIQTSDKRGTTRGCWVPTTWIEIV